MKGGIGEISRVRERGGLMTASVLMTELWRGPLLESMHFGDAVICDASGGIVDAWGDPQKAILPRSAVKMIQALPMIESGAADAFGLSDERLALACASHQAAHAHTDRVTAWLGDLGLAEPDLRCGPQMPHDRQAFNELIISGDKPCQIHNNCSGKHSGFLTLNRHLGGGPEYIEIDHPVQKACLEAFESVTREDSPGYGIDGCSAPNFITTLHGMARAMAWFAAATEGADVRQTAAVRLRNAMMAHPLLVAGEKRACTELMRAVSEPVALKTGAEGVFAAILPTLRLGIALKIADGTTRASNCAIAALLVRIGVLDPDHPTTIKFMTPPIKSRRGFLAGHMKPADTLL